MTMQKLNHLPLLRQSVAFLAAESFLFLGISPSLALPTESLRPRPALTRLFETDDGQRRQTDEKARQAAEILTEKILEQPVENRGLYFWHLKGDALRDPSARALHWGAGSRDAKTAAGTLNVYADLREEAFRQASLTGEEEERFREIGFEEAMGVLANQIVDRLGEEDGRYIASAHLSVRVAAHNAFQLLKSGLVGKDPEEMAEEIDRIAADIANIAKPRLLSEDPEVERRAETLEKLIRGMVGDRFPGDLMGAILEAVTRVLEKRYGDLGATRLAGEADSDETAHDGAHRSDGRRIGSRLEVLANHVRVTRGMIPVLLEDASDLETLAVGESGALLVPDGKKFFEQTHGMRGDRLSDKLASAANRFLIPVSKGAYRLPWGKRVSEAIFEVTTNAAVHGNKIGYEDEDPHGFIVVWKMRGGRAAFEVFDEAIGEEGSLDLERTPPRQLPEWVRKQKLAGRRKGIAYVRSTLGFTLEYDPIEDSFGNRIGTRATLLAPLPAVLSQRQEEAIVIRIRKIIEKGLDQKGYLEALREVEAEVRQAVHSGGRFAAYPLIPLMDDPDPEVSRFMGAFIRDHEAFFSGPLVRDALRGEGDSRMRALTLVVSGASVTASKVVPALLDLDEKVRERAKEAILLMPEEASGPLVAQALRLGDPQRKEEHAKLIFEGGLDDPALKGAHETLLSHSIGHIASAFRMTPSQGIRDEAVQWLKRAPQKAISHLGYIVIFGATKEERSRAEEAIVQHFPEEGARFMALRTTRKRSDSLMRDEGLRILGRIWKKAPAAIETLRDDPSPAIQKFVTEWFQTHPPSTPGAASDGGTLLLSNPHFHKPAATSIYP